MTAAPQVSIVVVSYNAREHVLRCLEAVERHTGRPHELLVVDNASEDGGPAAVRARHPRVRMFANAENLGFARANNQALRHVSAPYVLLLNPDTELQAGTLDKLLGLLEARPEVGWVGPRTLSGDGAPQVSFGPRLSLGSEWRQRRLVNGVRARRPAALREAERTIGREQEPDWVSASCALARVEALRAVGGFDERFFLYEEDVDLCLRLRTAGWRIVHCPAATVVHHLGRSAHSAPALARLEYQRSHLRYYLKHQGFWQVLGLRLLLAAGAAWGFVRARGPARREQLRLLRLALRERG